MSHDNFVNMGDPLRSIFQGGYVEGLKIDVSRFQRVFGHPIFCSASVDRPPRLDANAIGSLRAIYRIPSLGATISETLISDPTRIRAQLILSNHLLRGMDVFVTNEFDLRTRTNQFSFAGFEWANHNWNIFGATTVHRRPFIMLNGAYDSFGGWRIGGQVLHEVARRRHPPRTRISMAFDFDTKDGLVYVHANNNFRQYGIGYKHYLRGGHRWAVKMGWDGLTRRTKAGVAGEYNLLEDYTHYTTLKAKLNFNSEIGLSVIHTRHGYPTLTGSFLYGLGERGQTRLGLGIKLGWGHIGGGLSDCFNCCT